jgi:hypothetical protein
MSQTNGGRRRVLEPLLAVGAATGSGVDRASAHPGLGVLPLHENPKFVMASSVTNKYPGGFWEDYG